LSKIFVVIKCGKEVSGEVVFATTERAFNNEEAAKTWLVSKEVVWEEVINGFHCYCERAVHETELD